ncbi:MAG: hypothetical protein K2X55_17545 [Burkholderiaceae bacterium]|nr:hypothetical protein [Burkholderiaceae bacterium]
MGGTSSWTMRPTMALPAHSNGASVNRNMVVGWVAGFMRTDFTHFTQFLQTRKKMAPPLEAPKKDRLKIPVLGESHCVSMKGLFARRTTSIAEAFFPIPATETKNKGQRERNDQPARIAVLGHAIAQGRMWICDNDVARGSDCLTLHKETPCVQ